jgi:hypothetical protein
MDPGTFFGEADNQRRTGQNILLSDADLAMAEGFELRHVERGYEIVRVHAADIERRAEGAREPSRRQG